MSSHRRVWRLVIVGLLLSSWSIVTGASSASASSKIPLHNVVCHYTPDVPYQFGHGAPVHADGHITCTPTPPDISVTVIRLWRYDGGGKYTKLVEKTSSQLGTDWWITAQASCGGSRAYPMHVELLNSSFHGNWSDVDNNSITVTMYC
jgi:hypothetical protein